MEFCGRTEVETYYPEATATYGNSYIVVKYGWYMFSFRLEQGEKRTPAMFESAKQQAHALLMLDDENRDEWEWIRYCLGVGKPKLTAALLEQLNRKGNKK